MNRTYTKKGETKSNKEEKARKRRQSERDKERTPLKAVRLMPVSRIVKDA